MQKDTGHRAPWASLIVLLAATLLALALERQETARRPALLKAHSFQVSAWAPYWDRARVRASFTAHVAGLDEINFFWYQVRPDGSLHPFVGAEDAALLTLARAHDLRVLPTVTNNFDGPAIAALLSNEEMRDAHVLTLVALVKRMSYDGIELDYEALPAEARDDFTALVEALAGALHARDKLLSIAVHPKTDDLGAWDGPRAQDWPRLGAAADEFKVLAYDYHWPASPPGPIAPLDWIDSVLAYAERTVPADKIWLGLPFYGYDWTEQQGTGLTWAIASRLIRQHRPAPRRDPSGELYFSYTVDDVQHTVYLPDARAIARKVRLARQRHPNIAGVAVWRLGGGSPDHWAAIRRER